MWAFSLYDKEKNILFCSRDRFGIKPFYYTEIDNIFAFGSEIKQLLEFQKENICNKELLIDFIVTGIQEHTNETFFENIYKLEQSHNLIYDLNSNTYMIERYYNISLDNEISKFTEQKSVEIYEKALRAAIKLRLRSDEKKVQMKVSMLK